MLVANVCTKIAILTLCTSVVEMMEGTFRKLLDPPPIFTQLTTQAVLIKAMDAIPAAIRVTHTAEETVQVQTAAAVMEVVGLATEGVVAVEVAVAPAEAVAVAEISPDQNAGRYRSREQSGCRVISDMAFSESLDKCRLNLSFAPPSFHQPIDAPVLPARKFRRSRESCYR